MKKTPLLNSALSQLIAGMGHGDMLVIGDAGLPVPPQVPCIDLALTKNIPGFLDTLRVVLAEMEVEKAIVAQETALVSPAIDAGITALLPYTPLDPVPHEQFKQLTAKARAIVRTGQFTPYANIILVAGVVF
ncbi:D-ribose pyranase [Janthinobacterium fluminis]|uniref:D-ribose pyranase n=1 Tax=Janthinobacterium fluminis TaxID=2987524 RepID=A0ABT5K1S8_9BURK|nr:D-ribose pyranase [Janthinobacterium fluminis]MDC8758395.1 D-ribose pyranase [Janthinobacterium fluminis]